jgi:hypothetical protein
MLDIKKLAEEIKRTRKRVKKISYTESIREVSIAFMGFNSLRSEVIFDNGYTLSIIKGTGTHSDDNTCEIAIVKDGELSTELFRDEDQGDSVIDYCSKQKVLDYALLISRIAGKQEIAEREHREIEEKRKRLMNEGKRVFIRN